MARSRSTKRAFDDTPPELRWPLGPLATGVLLFAWSAVVALALLFPDGALSGWLHGVLRGAFGYAAYLSPLLLVGLALAAWRPQAVPTKRLERHAIVSWLVILVSVAGLLQPFTGRPAVSWDGDGGGLLGWLFHSALDRSLGPVGALVILSASAFLAVCVALGLRPLDFVRAFRWVLRWLELHTRRQFGGGLTINHMAKKRRVGLHLPIPRLRHDDFTSESGLAGSASSAAVHEPPALGPMLVLPPGPGARAWVVPPVAFLQHGAEGNLTQVDVEKKAIAIEEALADFDVYARVVEVNPGPTVTQFGLRPGYRERKNRAGEVVRRDKIKVSEITALANDLALALAAPSIRIEAPVPGRQLVGIEVPNGATGMVTLRDVIESEKFQKLSQRAKLALGLGKDVAGGVVAADLARMPHLLIAGATGSGKSACVNSIIATLLLHATPDELKLLMVDPKRVELTGYNDIPHLLRPVVTEIDKVISVLRWVTHEMDERYKRFEIMRCRNLDSYNRLRATRPELEAIPYLVVIIDELADIMMMAADEVEPSLCRLAQMARAVGIHVIVATQRPSVDVITGLIKANFPTRIAFAVTSQVDSRTIIDSVGAEKLLGRGDMLYLAGDAPKPVRLQGAWIDDNEIQAIVEHWKNQGTPSYVEELVNAPAWIGGEDEVDDLFERALEVAREHTRVSTSLLQRRLRIGYPRAARLVEVLEERGIVGPSDGAKSREVLLREESESDDPGSDDPLESVAVARV